MTNTHVSRVLDGRSIDKMSEPELRAELRAMIEYAARLEAASVCMHEDLRSVEYSGVHEEHVRMYTCRNCNFSWKVSV